MPVEEAWKCGLFQKKALDLFRLCLLKSIVDKKFYRTGRENSDIIVEALYPVKYSYYYYHCCHYYVDKLCQDSNFYFECERTTLQYYLCRGEAFQRVDSQDRGCRFESCTRYNKNMIGEEGNGKPPTSLEKPRNRDSGFC